VRTLNSHQKMSTTRTMVQSTSRTTRGSPAGSAASRIVMLPLVLLLAVLTSMTPTVAFQSSLSPVFYASSRMAIGPSTRQPPAAPPRRSRSFAFATRSSSTTNSNKSIRLYAGAEEEDQPKGILDFIFNPYESKIPKEIEKDIYAAEANTPAAQERGQRIALYALAAFTGILCAFFNGFLTELRGDEGFDLAEAGFGWVTSNFLLSFLFTNKIGGLLCLLGGGGAGLLAEAEYDTRRINAEKIFEEMQRRRAEKEAGGGKKKRKSSGQSQTKSSKNKGLSGKERKRMSALSEVVVDNDTTTTGAKSEVEAEVVEKSKNEEKEPVAPKQEGGGIFGTIKNFYEKADNMAASQALLLNKKLEDEGLIEKITDESGLKIIGKEEAAKLKAKKEPSSEKQKSES